MLHKPSKPTPDFPLFAHSSGKWGKKIRGKIYYFGRWDDPAGALAEYQEFSGAIAPPDPPREFATALATGRAVALFLSAKLRAVETGELERRTYLEYQRTCERFAAYVGPDTPAVSLRPVDFAKFKEIRASTLNIVSLGNEITRVKVFLKWLHKNGHLPHPPQFGTEFRKPPSKAVRRHRREKGQKLFSASDLMAILDECGIHLRAMVLLGINCGYGPHDCAMLPLSAINLDTGWADWPRPKTEVDRLCPLWPETIDALRLSLERRPDSTDRFFVRRDGSPWSNDQAQISRYFSVVRARVVRDGGFYWLRHTFETIGGGAKDQVAVNHIMGHVDSTMAATYRENIDPERLRAVTDHVRAWLLSAK